MKLYLSLAFLSSALAYTPSQSTPTTRRDAFAKAAASFGLGAVLLQQPANALELCPKKSNNCVRTAWTPPEGTSKEDAIAMLRKVLDSYPQGGQSGVDLGGWSIAEDDLSGSGAARLEYLSGTTGFFAKNFNGGKPFVDDLKLEVESTGVVQVRSQSRVGDSDLGVNKKRVDFLAKGLGSLGWSV